MAIVEIEPPHTTIALLVASHGGGVQKSSHTRQFRTPGYARRSLLGTRFRGYARETEIMEILPENAPYDANVAT
jgi:hypothetical protein